MSRKPKFFPRAYGVKTQSDVDAMYNDWADSYDEELIENGYMSPIRAAQALCQFLPNNASVLDFGCGTGLSGKALKSCGYTNISGSEINSNMLEKARMTGAYKSLFLGNILDPFPFETGTYDAITAVGVISTGAGPALLLPIVLDALAEGGILAFSLNDAALADPTYLGELEKILERGAAKVVFCEYGPHLTASKVGSTIYVLKRL